MQDLWLLSLVFCAIAIGWLMGRRVGRSKDPASMPSQYYKGLNYLLNDQPDGALDAFIDALEVNSDTLDTHLAVGNLMRRKGEVERAIRIHQNLLARPSLAKEHLHQAHLELARDFISAGLLDRAERLLGDLLEEAPELRNIAMRHLLEIYQDEKEWDKAIETAQKLLPRKSLLKSSTPEDTHLKVALAHYCCELAEIAQQKNDYHSARVWLKQALNYDRNCVRASLIFANVEYSTQHYQSAIKILSKVRKQDPDFILETIALLKECHALEGTLDDFHQYMLEVLEAHPSTSILLSLVDDIQQRQGDKAAADFIGRQLKQRASLKGLAKLVNLHVANSEGRAQENLTILQLLIDQLIQSRPNYQCHHCGFSGKQLHWLCPGCKQWGEVKSIRGTEGD
jgi:lipopolysaccharide biosynthesis regulator YciM